MSFNRLIPSQLQSSSARKIALLRRLAPAAPRLPSWAGRRHRDRIDCASPPQGALKSSIFRCRGVLQLALPFFLFCSLQAQLAVSDLGILPNNRYTPVLRAIASATTTLDVVMYDFSDSLLVKELIATKDRGVTVRVILNQHFAPFATPNTVSANPITKAELEANGIAVEYGNPAFTYTHQKTLIIDSATATPSALVMTLNFEPFTFGEIRDFSILVTTAAAVTEIQDGFNADWNRTAFSPSETDLVWSPNNSLTKIQSLINNAQYTLDIYMELFGDPVITAALISAVTRGVVVRAIVSPPINLNEFGQSYNFVTWGASLNAAPIQQLEAGGIQFHFVTLPYIHAKILIADQGRSSANAFIGSENLYTGSFENNRELGILTNNAGVIQQLEDVFIYDWNITRGF